MKIFNPVFRIDIKMAEREIIFVFTSFVQLYPNLDVIFTYIS